MKKKENKKTFWPVFFSIAALLFLNFLAHRVWFNLSATVSNGDWLYMFPEALKISQQASWVSSFPQATPFGGVNILPIRTITAWLGQVLATFHFTEQSLSFILFFLPISIVCPIGSYYCLYKFTKHNIASFVGALFYLFSMIFLVNSSAGYPFILIYGFVPFVFLLFDNLLHEFSIKNILLFILVSAYLNIFAIYLMFIVYGILGFYAGFILISKRYNVRNIRVYWWKLGLFVLLALLTNFYLILFAFSKNINDSVASDITSRALIIPGYLFFSNAITTFYPFWTGTQPTMFYNQPVVWYFWSIPFYVFLSIFFVRRNKIIIFFLALAVLMVFLGKGPSEPFAKLYEIAFNHIPLFNIYREASKFWIGIIFSYYILIGFTICYIFSLINTFSLDPFKKLVLKVLFVSPLLVIIFLSAKPAFTTKLGPGYISYSIPKEYITLKTYFVHDLHFYRILQMPAFSRLQYFSEIHPRLAYNDLPPQLQSLDPQVLRLYGVKYVILPIDPYLDVFPGSSRREVYKRGIEKQRALVLDPTFPVKEIHVYRNSSGIVPHVYATEKINLVSGEMKNIDDFYPLFSSSQSDFFLKNKDNPNVPPITFSQLITLSDCVTCLNTTASESSQFTSFTTMRDGEVYFFLKKYGVTNFRVFIDSQLVDFNNEDEIYYESMVYLKKGKHAVNINFDRENLVDSIQQEFSIDQNKAQTFVISEERLLSHTPYTFSFNYKVPIGVKIDYSLDQNTDFYFQYQQNKPGGTPWKAAKGEIIGDGTWKPFSVNFTTLFNPEWIQLTMKTKNSDSNPKTIEFQNISLLADISPQLIIKEMGSNKENDNTLPNVVFQEVNPTKYLVHVTNAKNPFILFFNESFNKQWQASYVSNSSKNVFEGPFLSTDMANVKEIAYKNSYDLYGLFLGKTNETLENHFPINGYANGWYVEKKGDYNLLLEFKPQKEFMIGLLITAGGFIVVIVALLLAIAYKHKKRN